MFGTSVASGLPGLLNIRDAMQGEFSGIRIVMAFSSGVIRRIWHRRAEDQEYRAAHPGVPAEILAVPAPRSAVSSLLADGFRAIVIQAVHMTPANEYRDLCRVVADLRQREKGGTAGGEPRRLAVGRPALGSPDDPRHPQGEDLAAVAAALAGDVELAERERAALVYLGHGSKDMPEKDNIYKLFEAEMRGRYPEVPVHMATIEGIDGTEAMKAALRRHGVRRVLLKPFLIAAGGHVLRDMAGGHPESLENRLRDAGFEVRTVLRGLGEQDRFARIFVNHAAAAAKEARIGLR